MNKAKAPKPSKPAQKRAKKKKDHWWSWPWFASTKKKDHWWSWPWFVSTWSRVVLAVGILFAAISGIVLIDAYYKFSRMIDRKISGEVFQNTAKVYASPMVLFPGQSIRPWDITNYLKKVGYSEKGKGQGRLGEYSYSKRSLEITPLPGSHYGSSDASVRIAFNEKSIARINSPAVKTDLTSYEVEPQLITNLFDKTREKRRLIQYDDIPKVLRDAVLAIEDRRFFEHQGIDPIGMMRAAFVDVTGRGITQGASTITQQLVRSFWLSPERKVLRKAKEIYMAFILENRLDKKQIFTLYANDVYLGQRGSFSINGFGEAATSYFNKDIKNLTIPEAALLAGIIQAPSRYNPTRNPDRALQRRNVVMQSMLETGSISKEQYQQASKTPLNLAPISMDVSDAPYFVDLVKDRMLEKYPESVLLSQQYKIYTTLDLDLQRFAYQAVRDGAQQVDETLAKKRLRKIKVKKGQPPPELKIEPQDRVQACLIALDPHTGEIRAFVGGRDYGTSQLNRLTTAKRQPGSIFKPFVYAAAVNSAVEGSDPIITASTIVDDSPTVFEFDGKTYEPNNFGEKFYGPVTLRKGLTKSLNVATIKFAEMAGLGKVVALAKSAGLNSKLLATPALALGSYEVTPMEMARAYTIFANHGTRVEPVFIRSTRDSKGSLIEKNETKTNDVLDPRITYLMTNLMEGVIARGTAARARALGFTLPAAGKTGTSHDGWFAGYTSGLLCIVWVGFDDNRELGLEGASSALPIWTEFMKKATALQPWLANSSFSPPEEGITSIQIDEDTGLLASSECQHVISENYITGSEPKQTCSLTAHNWILNLRNAPFEMSSESPESQHAVDSGKSEPLTPPKQPNALKRFFSKIF
jgi:penicillin-binding protein 1B